MEEFRKKDAEQGVKVAQVLQGFISRKVVKQTVMTVVYGVTRYGGRLQMEKRLKEFDGFPEVASLPQQRFAQQRPCLERCLCSFSGVSLLPCSLCTPPNPSRETCSPQELSPRSALALCRNTCGKRLTTS